MSLYTERNVCFPICTVVNDTDTLSCCLFKRGLPRTSSAALCFYVGKSLHDRYPGFDPSATKQLAVYGKVCVCVCVASGAVLENQTLPCVCQGSILPLSSKSLSLKALSLKILNIKSNSLSSICHFPTKQELNKLQNLECEYWEPLRLDYTECCCFIHTFRIQPEKDQIMKFFSFILWWRN